MNNAFLNQSFQNISADFGRGHSAQHCQLTMTEN